MTRVRVATHVHSAWSYDAAWSLPRLATAFRRRGYDAVLMSEHDQGFGPSRWQEYVQACAEASQPGLLLVPGIEYGDDDNAVHIPVWGEVPFLGSGHGTLGLLQRAHEAGAFTVFAHPQRRQAWRRFDPSWTPHLSAVEVWNRKYDGWAPSRVARDLAGAHAVEPFVSLDFHTRRQFFPLGLAMDLDGAPAVPEVFAALSAGAYRPLISRVPVDRVDGALGRVLEAAEAVRRRAAAVTRRPRQRR